MRQWLKKFLKRVARLCLGDYAVYRVLKNPEGLSLSTTTLDNCSIRPIKLTDIQRPDIDMNIMAAAPYFGVEALVFGAYQGERLVGLAAYWWGQRYETRGSWPISASSAKLVHIVICKPLHGQGIARTLIKLSAHYMEQIGRRQLYARIWHSHDASRRAFEHAGWQPVGWLIQLQPLAYPIRWCIRLG